MSSVKNKSISFSSKFKLLNDDLAYKMEMEEKAKKLTCPNKECKLYGVIGADNITFRERYGFGSTQNLFKCNTCNRTFSERRDTPLYGLRLPEDKIWGVVKCLIEGNGTRATSRIMGVHRDTVTKITKLFGTHAKEISEAFLKNYPLKECQLDELWTFIKKNRKM